jgi:hypothetical protein
MTSKRERQKGRMDLEETNVNSRKECRRQDSFPFYVPELLIVAGAPK